MLRVCLALFLVSTAFAENPPAEAPKVPPEVDAALRARVSQFFQFEVAGKFYQALQFVSEDSKEFFVGSNKATYLSSEIQSIQYFDNFTRATAYVRVTRLAPAEGFLGHPLPWSVPSRWKMEDGKWCWYVDPDDLRQTPFGIMPKGSTVYTGPPPMAGIPPGLPANLPGLSAAAPAKSPGGPATTTPNLPSLPAGMPANLPPGFSPSMIPTSGGTVIADKSAVALKLGETSADQVTITNQMQMPVTLALHWGGVPGLTAKLDRTDLKPGEKTSVIIQANDRVKLPEKPVRVAVQVLQTNQFIPIDVSFGGPPK